MKLCGLNEIVNYLKALVNFVPNFVYFVVLSDTRRTSAHAIKRTQKGPFHTQQTLSLND